MARGPRGEWRPPDPVARAVHIGRIATGEIAETLDPPKRSAASDRASKAAKARAASQTPERRREAAKVAASARWGARP